MADIRGFNSSSPTYVGTPYHGLVKDGTVTLPNGSTYDIPGFVILHPEGPSYKLQHPSPPGANRTLEQEQQDILDGLEWKTYALKTEEHVNGMAITSSLWIIYIDPAGTAWHLRYIFDYEVNDNTTMHCTIENRGRFGFLSRDHATVANPVLIQHTFMPINPDYDGVDPKPEDYKFYPENPDQIFFGGFSQNENGSLAMFNVSTGTGAPDFTFLNQIVTVNVSGTGSLSRNTFGNGINVTFDIQTLPHDGTPYDPIQTGSGGAVESEWDDGSKIITASPRSEAPSGVVYNYFQKEVYYKYIWHDGTVKEVSERQEFDSINDEAYGGIATWYCGGDPEPPTVKNGSMTAYSKSQTFVTWVIGDEVFNWQLGVERPARTFGGDDMFYQGDCTFTPVPGGTYGVKEEVYNEWYDTEVGLGTWPRCFGQGKYFGSSRHEFTPVLHNGDQVLHLTQDVSHTVSIFDKHIRYAGRYFQYNPDNNYFIAYQPVDDDIFFSQTELCVYI